MSSYDINKSSLLSLKAEILRKEEGLTKAKIDNIEKAKSIKKKTFELKNKGIEKRQENDLNEEERDLLKLSRSKLEAKAKLYDKLSSKSHLSEDVNRRYLVQFNQKTKASAQYEEDPDEPPDLPVDSEEERYDSDYYDEDVNPEDQWVEYTDSLGRTRKCLRKDLDDIKSRDAELKDLAKKRHQAAPESAKNPPEDMEKDSPLEEEAREIDVESQIAEQESEMISGDMRREMLRRQWEMEEDELRDKTDIHYQNILFNEARQHGVGYYAFSKDEEERAKQQEALKKLRAETEQKQKRAVEVKEFRDKQMAARIKAAKNRRRARLGLPPEEDEPEAPPAPDTESEEQKKKQEKKTKKQLEREEKLNEARKRHVRPWDIGKEGVSEFYEMSQHEWNEKKRKERRKEFAPPTVYSKRDFSGMRTLESHNEDSDKSLRFTTKSLKKRSINPYKYDEDSPPRKLSHRPPKSKSYEPEEPTSDQEGLTSDAMAPTPIMNEVEDTEFGDSLLADYNKVMEEKAREVNEESRSKRTEIPPPPTFEYFGPLGVPPPTRNVGQMNISESIEAGLKFLRSQEEQKRKFSNS
ncbi:coiled-coil domain-containing protein 174 [Euwallacea fornicatus]|uniref:coiled-coil domain-containing protein 174 n=1 Tax=Euwallacea fornicatus TaxID=995702 RepID=UPI00338F77F6